MGEEGEIETDVIDKRSSFRNRSASYIRVQMPEELDESELIDHKVNVKLSKMSYLRSCISEESIERLKHRNFRFIPRSEVSY